MGTVCRREPCTRCCTGWKRMACSRGATRWSTGGSCVGTGRHRRVARPLRSFVMSWPSWRARSRRSTGERPADERGDAPRDLRARPPSGLRSGPPRRCRFPGRFRNRRSQRADEPDQPADGRMATPAAMKAEASVRVQQLCRHPNHPAEGRGTRRGWGYVVGLSVSNHGHGWRGGVPSTRARRCMTHGRSGRCACDDREMAHPTHATLATFRTDLSREEEQRIGLERFIVPGVRQFPGFVSGLWTLDRSAEESVVVISYDSRQAAEAMAANIRGNATNQKAAGLELVSVRILEVAARA
jgi:hypothetical protein